MPRDVGQILTSWRWYPHPIVKDIPHDTSQDIGTIVSGQKGLMNQRPCHRRLTICTSSALHPQAVSWVGAVAIMTIDIGIQ